MCDCLPYDQHLRGHKAPGRTSCKWSLKFHQTYVSLIMIITQMTRDRKMHASNTQQGFDLKCLMSSINTVFKLVIYKDTLGRNLSKKHSKKHVKSGPVFPSSLLILGKGWKGSKNQLAECLWAYPPRHHWDRTETLRSKLARPAVDSNPYDMTAACCEVIAWWLHLYPV